MTEAQRREFWVDAGHNPLRLPPARVPFDLFSDVPHRVLVPDGARSGDVDVDAACAAFAPLTGGARLALATKGRSAENALVDALELDGPPTVLTHGLFTTTQAALARRGAVLEDLRVARSEGTVDIDLDHLTERLAAGKVQIVYLEVANNALFGWPLSHANVAAVREACDRFGAKLLLDAARPLANAAALGASDLVASARELLGLAHAFTISCAKEMLVPVGSVIGSPDAALITRAWQLLFKHGTSLCAIDPPQLRADLADGARYVLAHPELVVERNALARTLGAALREAGVPVIDPVTAHAVYLPIDRTLLAGEVPALISLLGQLYVVGGVRAQVSTTKRGPAIRLALPLRTTLDADAMRGLAAGVAAFFGRIGERFALKPVDGQVDVPYFRRFALA